MQLIFFSDMNYFVDQSDPELMMSVVIVTMTTKTVKTLQCHLSLLSGSMRWTWDNTGQS